MYVRDLYLFSVNFILYVLRIKFKDSSQENRWVHYGFKIESVITSH